MSERSIPLSIGHSFEVIHLIALFLTTKTVQNAGNFFAFKSIENCPQFTRANTIQKWVNSRRERYCATVLRSMKTFTSIQDFLT